MLKIMADKNAQRVEKTTDVRQGVISRRVIFVLIGSLALALLAMIFLLGYFYSTHSAIGI